MAKGREVVIDVCGIHKTLAGKAVLQGVELQVRRGEILVIIGRSGGGKSVLLRHLVGLMKPDVGQVWVEGTEITRLREAGLNRIRLKVGVLFQDAALFDSLSVFDNVAFALREHTRMKPEQIAWRVRECLATVDLHGVEDQSPETLSGGMRKRVGLARALAMTPKIMLYDEPTAGLDRLTGQGINELILKLNQKLDVTSVVVTHDIESARATATRIALLDGGRIVALGTPGQLEAQGGLVRDFLKREGLEGELG